MYQMKLTKIFLYSIFVSVLFSSVFATTISEIQGNGASSPLEGQTITTEGNIVTFVTEDGFFIQSTISLEDNDPETSEGVYVVTQNSGVSVGDIVNIEAKVSESYYLTELNNATVTIVSSENTLPPPIVLGIDIPSKTPTSSLSELERYEGMLVTFENGLVCGAPDSYGTMFVNPYGTRTFNEPGIKYPGIDNLPIWDGNPELIGVDLKSSTYKQLLLFAGTTINLLEGPLTYSYGNYKIIPHNLTYEESNNLPRAVRTPETNEISIGTQNMLRLSEFDSNTKFKKLSLQVRENLKAPDILAIQEVFTIETLQKLADQIHLDDNSISYTPYLLEGNSSGIDSGFLVKNNVTVNNVYQKFKDETIQSGTHYDPLHDRPPLVMECSISKQSKSISLTIICVHNRSLNDVDSKDFVREKRFRQAEDIAEFVNSLQIANPQINIIITGDFNCHQFTDGYVDGLGIITGNLDSQGAMLKGTDLVELNLRNQIYSLPFSERYSYVHEGNSSVLDHMLTSFNLNKYIVEINYARGNADVSETFENTADTALRSSDHDGLVMYLKLVEDSSFDTVIPLSELISTGFNENSVCKNYFTNTSGTTQTLTFSELDSTGTELNQTTYNILSGEKIELSNFGSNEFTTNLILSSENNGCLFSEILSETGQMTSYINQKLSTTKFVPHIAEQIDQWDSFIFLSSPEKQTITINVADNSGSYEDNYAFFENCEQYLDTSGETIPNDSSYGTLTSISSKISGFEIFKKDGNDGAATELIAQGEKTLYIPHIPTEIDIFWTGFSFLNTTGTIINSNVTLFNNSGDAIYTYEFAVPAHTKIVNVLSGIFPNAPSDAQWGIVESDGNLIGLELYGTYSAGICGFSLNGKTLSDGIIPHIYKGDNLWTGIAFANPDIETALVFVRLVSKNGTVKEEKNFEIPAKQRVAFVVSNYFDNQLIEDTDYITFYSEKPVIALEASGDLERTFMTALGAKNFKH